MISSGGLVALYVSQIDLIDPDSEILDAGITPEDIFCFYYLRHRAEPAVKRVPVSILQGAFFLVVRAGNHSRVQWMLNSYSSAGNPRLINHNLGIPDIFKCFPHFDLRNQILLAWE